MTDQQVAGASALTAGGHRLASAVARPVLRLALGVIGRGLGGASWVHPRLRAQITRSLIFEISTDDGVARHFSFDGPSRLVRSGAGRSDRPDHALRFESSAQALVGLLSPTGMDRIVEDLHRDRVRVEGSTVVLMWFRGLIATLRPPAGRSEASLPGAYLAPDPTRAGGRITVEPPVRELDPQWWAAWRARARLPIIRAATGEPPGEP